MNDWIIDRMVDRLRDWLVGFVPDLVGALLIAIAGWFLANLVHWLIVRAAARRQWDPTIWGYWATFAKYVILAIVFMAALNQAGFPISSLLLTFGITGVMIGFGARASLQNYFAGMMMLSARPFKIGDLVEFGQPPQLGVVTHVAMTHTGLTTLDNVKLVVPNSVMWGNKIFNFSFYDLRAIRIHMLMAYEIDVDWVKDLSMEVLNLHPAVLNDPSPKFTVSDVTTEKVKVLLVAWTAVESMTIFGSVLTELRNEFKTAGLEITVPAQEIDLRREE